MRIRFRVGYRVYYAREGRLSWCTCCLRRRIKSTQKTDIKRAKAMWAMILKGNHGQSKSSPTFDASDYLTSAQAAAAYLDAALEEGDPDLLMAAIADVAKARGIAQVAAMQALAVKACTRRSNPAQSRNSARYFDFFTHWDQTERGTGAIARLISRQSITAVIGPASAECLSPPRLRA